jgi:hypothetical protein
MTATTPTSTLLKDGEFTHQFKGPERKQIKIKPQSKKRYPNSLKSLPAELQLLIFENLKGPVTSTCLGLTFKALYKVHRSIHGYVRLRISDHRPSRDHFLWELILEWAGIDLLPHLSTCHPAAFVNANQWYMRELDLTAGYYSPELQRLRSDDFLGELRRLKRLRGKRNKKRMVIKERKKKLLRDRKERAVRL